MIDARQTLKLLTPGPTDFVEVAVLERDGMVESRHRGIAALVGPDGKLIEQLGSAKRVIYPRSAVKPIQAVAMLRAGLKVSGEDLAICCASHQGTSKHLEAVQRVLASAGLSETDLQCPTAWPGNPQARAATQEETKLAFNCSGKHAGFLAASVAAGWDTATYLDPNHPIQVLTREVLEEYSGEKVLHSTIDGCGAPLHMLTVEGLARAIGKFATEQDQIVNAMLDNPAMVGDKYTVDAILMGEGLVVKLGAEGVLVVGLRDGQGVAVKIADGLIRSAPLVAVALLRRHGLIEPEVAERLNLRLAVESKAGNTSVGGLRAL